MKRTLTIPLTTLATVTLLLTGCDSNEKSAAAPPSAAPSTTATTESSVGSQAVSAEKQPPLLTDVEDVAVGEQMDCARRKDNSVWCWQGDRGARRTIMVETAKVAVVSSFVCAIQTQGQIACAKPYAGKIIDVPLYRDGVNIVGAAGGYCVDTEDGVLRCGVEDREQAKVKPPSGLPGLKHPAAFSVGAKYGCGIVEQDVWCWNNEKGPGLPKTMKAVNDPQGIAVGRQQACVHTEASEVWCYDLSADDKPFGVEARQQASWTAVAQLTMSYDPKHPDRLCGRRADGTVHCGELSGEGDAAAFAAPTPIEGVNAALQVATGATAHGCVRTKSGTVSCWPAGRAKATPVRLAAQGDVVRTAAQPQ